MEIKDVPQLEVQESQAIAFCDLSRESIPADITLSEAHELAKQEFNDDIFHKIIRLMLKAGGYHTLSDDLNLLVKQRTIITVASTDKGDKFLKLVEKNCGVDELEGGSKFQRYFPAIRAEKVVRANNVELIIQPYITDIGINNGMLTDVIGMLEILRDTETDSHFWQVFDDIFKQMYSLSVNTLMFKVGESKNDRFFYDRLKTRIEDGDCGRLEQFYKDAVMNIGGVEIQWDEFKHRQWVIDGVRYAETVEELMKRAKEVLDPHKERLIALCHGDGHEMNIYTNALALTRERESISLLI